MVVDDTLMNEMVPVFFHKLLQASRTVISHNVRIDSEPFGRDLRFHVDMRRRGKTQSFDIGETVVSGAYIHIQVHAYMHADAFAFIRIVRLDPDVVAVRIE